jgi:alpha-galactosidase
MKALTAVLLAAPILALALFGDAPLRAAQEATALRAAEPPPNAVWVDGFDLGKMSAGRHGKPGQSVRNTPIALDGQVYPHGLGVASNSELLIDLKGQAARFVSMVGIDDGRKTGSGSVTFEIWLDGKKAADSGLIKAGQPAKLVSVDLTGAKQMTLLVGDGGDGTRDDDADWAGAMIVMSPQKQTQAQTQAAPEAIDLPVDPAPAIASGASPLPQPRINGPRVVGASPNKPFLFLIPATGEAPLTFAAKNLPAGLALDAKTGIISGTLKQAGKTVVPVTVTGPKGHATRDLTIVSGDGTLAQTPPMGWNSWNVWARAVDAEKVRAAADGMVKSGLAAHGFQYINIDDTWEGTRAANGEIQTNEKFPDMKALADYVHSKGLKLGIYSSPGPKTCAQFEGSYQHEAQDAATYAKWGIDYLKYDWCSYRQIAPQPDLAALKKPYLVMRDALEQTDRDIVYSLCQYGMGNVWEWGAEVGGNAWRTTGDITDTWASMSGIGFSQDGHEKYAGPGHWNDPDMLVVGRVGWGPNIHPTRLTPNEQITHITLWSLQSSPLLIGADMSALDQFTTDVLSNDEVLAVNQDALGRAAHRVSRDGWLEVWARPLADGTMAVGLFNRGIAAATVSAKWAELGLSGRQPVRDLWQQRDLPDASDAFSTMVPRHGAVFVRIGRPKAATVAPSAE